MQYIYNNRLNKAFFKVSDAKNFKTLSNSKNSKLFTFLITNNQPVSVIIDHIPINLQAYQIISITPNQQFFIIEGNAANIYQFNREFYCVKDHDKEVNCTSTLLFYNNRNPIISIPEQDRKKFNYLYNELVEEFSNEDAIQTEMLQLLLKKFIITATRLSNSQHISKSSSSKFMLLNQFNALVEEYYKTEHKVSFYAEKLFKSPKTLSNSFHELGTSPLQIIQNRIVEETKRLLLYSDQSFKEIASELGYIDPSHLSRLFKNQVNVAPTLFKKQNYTTVALN